MALDCINGLITTDASNRPVCSGEWIQRDIQLESMDGLNQLLEMLFGFDPVIFFMVLSACILAFLKGWITGYLMRLFNKG